MKRQERSPPAAGGPDPLARGDLDVRRKARLDRLLRALASANPFYGPRIREAGLDQGIPSLDAFRQRMPFTTKLDLARDQEDYPPFGTNLTYPLADYIHFHQTSGSTGTPLTLLDTAESWRRMIEIKKQAFLHASMTPADRVFFPFSFGPYLGFWSAFGAAQALGCLCIPGGGMKSQTRLHVMAENQVTVLCCTPTYALRLAEVAHANGKETKGPGTRTLRLILVGGEPGGSIPATRQRLERAWPNARIFDHYGMTEVGPIAYESFDTPGVLYLHEEDYLAELIDPRTLKPVAPGERGELVLTTLRRVSSPVIRYRTGDWVGLACHRESRGTPRRVGLKGGVLGRVDDMIFVRGVNLYPSAVEQVLYSFAEVEEYRVELDERQTLTEIRVEIESASGTAGENLCHRIGSALSARFHLRIPVQSRPKGSLPRFEAKANRWVRLRAG